MKALQFIGAFQQKSSITLFWGIFAITEKHEQSFYSPLSFIVIGKRFKLSSPFCLAVKPEAVAGVSSL